MANATSKEQMEFVYAMAKHSKATLQDIRRLLVLGATHHAIQLAKCNVAMDTLIAQRFEAKESTVQSNIRIIVESFGASVVFSGDSQDCTVKLALQHGYSICVPTA